MSFCINCGVELDDELISCPLCGTNIGNSNKAEMPEKSEHFPSDIILLHKKEIRRNIWEFSILISFSGIAVCTIVDFVTSKILSWSLFADTAILTGWICLTLLLLAFRKYYIILPGLFITILGMLFLFDVFAPPADWFPGIGLPLTITLFVSISLMIILWKIARLKGFNFLAIAFLDLSVFCLISEVFIDKYIFGKVDIRWSAIVAVSIFPIALALLFMHYRMQKGKNLDSYFHV